MEIENVNGMFVDLEREEMTINTTDTAPHKFETSSEISFSAEIQGDENWIIHIDTAPITGSFTEINSVIKTPHEVNNINFKGLFEGSEKKPTPEFIGITDLRDGAKTASWIIDFGVSEISIKTDIANNKLTIKKRHFSV